MPQRALDKPEKIAKRVEGLSLGVPSVSFLFSTLLGFNMGQVASLLLRPFSKKAFRKLNRWGADTWWGWCDTLAKGVHGSHICVSGDELPMREDAICFANHQQMADIPFLMMLARSKDRLGDMKWIVKKQIKYVPGVGWGMSFLDCVYVDRTWTADRKRIMDTFATLRDERVPVWLMVFPEGTRIQPHKLKAAQKYAQERGFFYPRHVLIPRTKGFAAAVQGLRGHITAVYDVTMGYPGGVPSIWQYIQGFGKEAHLHVRRYSMETLPESTEDLSAWLVARYEEKDELLEKFYTTGSFV